jgi:hypothetical protein
MQGATGRESAAERVPPHQGGGSACSDRPQRVFLLTWYKAGSQWVRDLLTHRLAARASGLVNSGATFNCLEVKEWPATPAGSFAGPIYCPRPIEWDEYRLPTDRGVVVLRDPRDIVVSLAYSLTFSHLPTPITDHLRPGLLRLPMTQRLMLAMMQFRRPRVFADWGQLGWGPRGELFVTSYERLVADTCGELSAMYEFLGWDVSAADVARIVADLSFETRSGRSRGQEDPLSHLRKGVPGDWRSHFDRLAGLTFELHTWGSLVRSGYESDPLWYESLPETAAAPLDLETGRQLRALVELQAEVVRLREENQWLRRELAQKDAA